MIDVLLFILAFVLLDLLALRFGANSGERYQPRDDG